MERDESDTETRAELAGRPTWGVVAAAAAAGAAAVGLGFWVVMRGRQQLGGQQQQQQSLEDNAPNNSPLLQSQPSPYTATPPVIAEDAPDAATCIADAMQRTTEGMEQYGGGEYRASIVAFDEAIALFRAIPSQQMDCSDQIRTLLRNKSKAYGKLVAAMTPSSSSGGVSKGDPQRADALRDVIGCLDECLAHDPLFLRFLEERARYEAKCHHEAANMAANDAAAGADEAAQEAARASLAHLERAHFDLTRLVYLKKYAMNTSHPSKTSAVATAERKAHEIEVTLVAKRAESVCAAVEAEAEASSSASTHVLSLPCGSQTEFFLAQFATDSNFTLPRDDADAVLADEVAVDASTAALLALASATEAPSLSGASSPMLRVRHLLQRQRAHKRLRAWGRRGEAGADGPRGALFSDLTELRSLLFCIPAPTLAEELDNEDRADCVEAIVDLAALTIVCGDHRAATAALDDAASLLSAASVEPEEAVRPEDDGDDDNALATPRLEFLRGVVELRRGFMLSEAVRLYIYVIVSFSNTGMTEFSTL